MPERFPVAQQLELGEAQREAFHNRQATLLDIYGDQIVEVEGIRAPLSALFRLCPVDKETMTGESIDNYAADLIEKSGFELPEDVREVVTQRYEETKSAELSIESHADEVIEDSKKKVQTLTNQLATPLP